MAGSTVPGAGVYGFPEPAQPEGHGHLYVNLPTDIFSGGSGEAGVWIDNDAPFNVLGPGIIRRGLLVLV